MTQRRGPLTGVRAIEMAGLGAGPYTAMLLADLGADVVRVDRPGTRSVKPEKYALSRGRRSITIDLKRPEGLATLLTLVEKAHVMFEGYRPGVAEKLGFGPATCLERNPALIYGRMTGWGQTGPMSQMAGHDLNYLGLTGALGMLSRPGGQPAAPPGFVADMGGGGLLLAFGLVSALLESRTTGVGQVIDAAMIDGVASMSTLIHSMIAQGRWHDPPGSNFCDGGAPYYDTYVCSDGAYLAVAPIEPQFYGIMVERLGLDLDALPDRDDPANWDGLKALFANIFRSRTRDEWAELFDGSDACVTPVLSFGEAVVHPHNVARETYTSAFGVTQPATAPRFGRSPGSISGPPPAPGAQSRAVLEDWGVPAVDVDALVAANIVVEAT